MPIITNFKKLAKNDLRRKALEIAEAGYEAIEIEKAIKNRIRVENDFFKIITHPIIVDGSDVKLRQKQYKKVNLDDFKRIFLVGIGKGSALASAKLTEILNGRLNKGIVLDIQSPRGFTQMRTLIYLDRKIKFLTGTHPLPSRKNVIATQKIIKLVKNLKKDDLLIIFICGGGSSLLCGSEEELKCLQDVFKKLTKAGANIEELNTIRKHLSEIKGGNLAKLAYPAEIISLIVSDICGNDLSLVSSGPTVFDKTTKKDAERILKKYELELKNHLKETPKNKKYFKKVKNILFVCNQDAVMAMINKAEELGLSAKIHSLALQGEAKDALLPIIKTTKSKQVILAAGETTVNLKNQPKGKGGRNMEAVLGAINFLNSKSYILNSNLIVISVASDGHDNTEAAGAIGDILTLQKAKKLKINPAEFLKQNKSFAFFSKTGDLIYAEKKCFNVADLMIILKL